MNGEVQPAAPAEGGNFFRALYPSMKDSLLLGAWIGGLLLFTFLLWFLIQPLRLQTLQNSVNRTLIQKEYPRRLTGPVPRRDLDQGMKLRGVWYTLADSRGRALIFSITAGGVFIPCAAMVSPGGEVEEILPLTASAEKSLNRLSPGVIIAYVRRIEAKP